MTAATGDPQLSGLHTETIAAIEQRDALATWARRALIAALDAGRICRDGCADALTGWGLEPPPGKLTMSAAGQMSYARMHTDEDDARDDALQHVPEELCQLLPVVDIWPRWVIEVALIPGEDDHPEVHPYRITVQVGLRMPVTATSQAAAITAAETMVNARLPELADAGITLTGVSWEVYDGPDDLIYTADLDAPAAPADPAGASDDLTAATAARDAAVDALADLRRKIRRRAVHALATEEFGGVYEETAEHVERFLLDLGFDRLPRDHFVLATVDVTLRVGAGSAPEAYDQVRDLMATTDGPREGRPWTATGRGTVNVGEVDGWWRVSWRHVYDVWLRGQPDRAAASTAGEALVRAALERALAEVDHQVDLTCAVEGYGIPQHLDPDLD